MQLVERCLSDRKIADWRFDSRTGNALLRPWGKHFSLTSHWGQALLRVVTQLDERLANRILKRVLCNGVVRQMQNAGFIHNYAWINEIKLKEWSNARSSDWLVFNNPYCSFSYVVYYNFFFCRWGEGGHWTVTFLSIISTLMKMFICTLHQMSSEIKCGKHEKQR